jgi:hypothetical protein
MAITLLSLISLPPVNPSRSISPSHFPVRTQLNRESFVLCSSLENSAVVTKEEVKEVTNGPTIDDADFR